jgi:hypothetical protein
MYADTKIDTSLSRHTCIALGHTVLHFNGAANCIDYATELY